MEQKALLGLPGGAGINIAESCFQEGTCYLSDLRYFQTVTCMPLVRIGKDGWVPFLECQLTANLGPRYISVVFPNFCHCFVSMWECLIIHGANN